MFDARFFSYSATAQLVVDPLLDQVIAANQEACRMVGLDAHELTSTKASALFSTCFPWLVAFTQELIERGRGWRDDLLISAKNGELRVEVNGRYCAAGDEHFLYLSLQEVEELDQHRKQSDAQRHYLSGIGNWDRVSRIFQEFERGNQLLLEAAGEGIYGVDTHGITIFVNPAAEKILGYSAEELAGRNMHSMVHHSHSDGTNFQVNDCPIFSAFKNGEVQVVEDDVFWGKSGNAINVDYTSTPVRDNGFIVGAVVVFRDVSQRKSQERLLRVALDEVESLKTRLEMEKAYLQEEISYEFNHHQMIGRSHALKNVLQKISMVGPTEASVLISGESGTGKELIARAIHETSDRSDRPLIRVNCAAIPEDLFESEFFGHVKGAFTGAVSDRPGRFELADGGTIFLDEVGEIPLHLQSKLLRVLQEQQYERVGDTKTQSINVRIIAATNRDLEQSVEAGRFREDLYFRLNVFPIESIPLRKRTDDVPLLAQHFLAKASSRSGKQNLKIPMSELEKLKQYHWPGNIRELENVIERQVILAQSELVRFNGLITPVISNENTPKIEQNDHPLTEQEVKVFVRKNILSALELSKGRVSGDGGAADILAMKPTTLISRLKKEGIDPRKLKSPV